MEYCKTFGDIREHQKTAKSQEKICKLSRKITNKENERKNTEMENKLTDVPVPVPCPFMFMFTGNLSVIDNLPFSVFKMMVRVRRNNLFFITNCRWTGSEGDANHVWFKVLIKQAAFVWQINNSQYSSRSNFLENKPWEIVYTLVVQFTQ